MIVRTGREVVDLGPARARVEGSGLSGGPIVPKAAVPGAESQRRYVAANPERAAESMAAHRARIAVQRMLAGERPPATVVVSRVDV